MSQIVLSTKISEKVKKELQEFCEEKGLKMNRFIEKALIEKLSKERVYGPAPAVPSEFFDEETWAADWDRKEMKGYDNL